MATTMFPTDTASTRSSTSFTNGVVYKVLDLARGSGAVTKTDNTVASLGTALSGNGSVTAPWGAGASYSIGNPLNPPVNTLIWLSEPLAAVTISGSITYNVRALESSTMANYGVAVGLVKVAAGNGAASGSGGTGVFNGSVSNISAAELGLTEAASSWSVTPNSTTFADGDMLGVMIVYMAPVSAGTSASGFTASGFYGGASGATGDTFITFTETITLQTAAAATSLPNVHLPFIHR